jgi:hypothetical protein
LALETSDLPGHSLVQAGSDASAAVNHLVSLLEAGHVEEARALAPQFAARFPDSGTLKHLAGTLEPPRVWRSVDGPAAH